MIFKGFKFGMLLQLAVGPVCFFIFRIASLMGFAKGVTGVLGVVLIDGLYIFAAILGIASLIDRREIKTGLKILGSVIIFVFGLSTVTSQFNISLLPVFNVQSFFSSNSVLISSILLTASNPLTIVFWAGIFSSEIIKADMKKKEIYAFGFGSLLSTALFLILVAFAGSFTKSFFPPPVIQALNLIVGLLLIYFSIKMAVRRV